MFCIFCKQFVEGVMSCVMLLCILTLMEMY